MRERLREVMRERESYHVLMDSSALVSLSILVWLQTAETRSSPESRTERESITRAFFLTLLSVTRCMVFNTQSSMIRGTIPASEDSCSVFDYSRHAQTYMSLTRSGNRDVTSQTDTRGELQSASGCLLMSRISPQLVAEDSARYHHHCFYNMMWHIHT